MIMQTHSIGNLLIIIPLWSQLVALTMSVFIRHTDTGEAHQQLVALPFYYQQVLLRLVPSEFME